MANKTDDLIISLYKNRTLCKQQSSLNRFLLNQTIWWLLNEKSIFIQDDEGVSGLLKSYFMTLDIKINK